MALIVIAVGTWRCICYGNATIGFLVVLSILMLIPVPIILAQLGIM